MRVGAGIGKTEKKVPVTFLREKVACPLFYNERINFRTEEGS